jgi:hypothetical protein
MHTRFEGVTIDMLCPDPIVIYSTHQATPPAGFQGAWMSLSEDSRIAMRPSEELEVSRLASAAAALIFVDTKNAEHLQVAAHIACRIASMDEVAPPTIIVPHSSSAHSERMFDGDDAEWERWPEDLTKNTDAVIFGEPQGMRLACEVRSKIMQLSRVAHGLNEQMNQHRAKVMRVQYIEADIHEIVWEYLRVRFRTGLPGIDEELGPGQPEVVDGFVVGSKLGEGSFGVVCRLVDPQNLNSPSGQVIKMMAKQPISNFFGLASLKRELNVMEALSSEQYSHPNITKFYQVYHSESYVLFRLEDGGGMDLYKRLVRCEQQNLPLGLQKTTGIITQVMSALSHLHLGLKIAHRDVKPENLIVAETADSVTVKLADFDTAQFVPKGGLCRGIIGTFPFMAPEVMCGKRYDPLAADVWSLGTVSLEVLCRLNIMKKALNLYAPRNVSKREGEKLMTEKIYVFLRYGGSASKLVEKFMRPELITIKGDAQTLQEATLNVMPEQRWTAGDISEAKTTLFTAN